MNTSLTLGQALDLLERYKLLAREGIDYAEELEEKLGGYDNSELRHRFDQIAAFENGLRRAKVVLNRPTAEA